MRFDRAPLRAPSPGHRKSAPEAVGRTAAAPAQVLSIDLLLPMDLGNRSNWQRPSTEATPTRAERSHPMPTQEGRPTRPSPFRERRYVIVAVGGLSLVTGLFETATIVAIVAFIEGVTSGSLQWEVATGPFDLSLSRGELASVACIALAGMTSGQLLSIWMRARAVSGWQVQTQLRAMRAYMRAEWAAQSAESSGSLQNLMNLCSGSSQALSGLMAVLSAAGAVAIFTVAAFLASPLAAGALLATGTVLMVMLRPLRAASREATRQATIAQRAMAEAVGEIHDLAQEIRVHDATEAVGEQFTQTARHLRASRLRAMRLTGTGVVLYRSLGLTFVLVAAVIASSQTDLDVARVGVAGLLLLRSLSYGQSIQTGWQSIENSRPYIEQVGDAIEMYLSRTPSRGVHRIQRLGDLELTDVSYAYDDAAPALNGIHLVISSGETLGIVGPSGSGKSTLAQILLGLRAPSTGTYVAAGVPAIDIDADDWFRLVTLVPQHPQLLRGTVTENIIFYRGSVSSADAREAAVAAGLHDEIEALPAGYDTLVGDAIRDLSGGQRQRLGIARALAGHPQLLVLDEPTSALDALSEARIQGALSALRGRMSIVIIAHRLSTLNHCDRLLVLEGGYVQALDTPKVVMEENDFYRDAVKLQLAGAQNTE